MRWTNDTVYMELDDGQCTNEIDQKKNQCFVQITMHDETSHYLNVNGPMQVGGVSFGPSGFSQLSRLLSFDRKELPAGDGFTGCVRNLTFNGGAGFSDFLYDLGDPADGESFEPGCNEEFVQAVVALGINTHFLIAILVCLAVILILVIVLAVYRKRRNVFK